MKNMMQRVMIFILIGWSCCVADGEDKKEFPWLMTRYKYDHLTPEQRQIYLNAYFETTGFILYSYQSKEDPSTLKTLNAWIDCVAETNDPVKWSPDVGWIFGENLDKSPAYIFYNIVSPSVCEEYKEKAGIQVRTLKIYNHNDWQKWSIKDKGVYLAGYIDTAASFHMRLRDAGVENELQDLQIVIEAMGIEGILSDVMEIEFEQEYPLPWSISRGLGAARKRVFSDRSNGVNSS